MNQKQRDTGYGASDPVHVYLTDIGRTPLLSNEEEVRLAREIAAGREAANRLTMVGDETYPCMLADRRLVRRGAQAREIFLKANLRLVVSIARRYRNRGLPFLDLIQEGNLGLMHALDKFEVEKGFKFSTYATWWIRQNVHRALANHGRTIRYPVHLHDSINKLAATLNRLRSTLQREPAIEEIAAACHLEPARVVDLLGWLAADSPMSLDEDISPGDENLSLVDVLHDETWTGDVIGQVFEHLDNQRVEQLLALLDNEREREILRHRYGLGGREPITLQQVGEQSGLSRERIRQIEAAALRKMRERGCHLQPQLD
jgi:RNA polymerase sigma factor (sigma-70 family)